MKRRRSCPSFECAASYTVIDRITAHLNIKEDRYEAEFSNLGVKNIPLLPDYVLRFDRLLCGGIWCIVQLEYEYIEEDMKINPIGYIS
jgi:ATP-dependent Lon protease